jgi:predicted nucleic acid-binding protein
MTRLYIVDTNVLVAGLLTTQADSPTARLVDPMLNGSLMFLLSPALLAEYRGVLIRPKLVAAHRLNTEEMDDLLSHITANAVWREPLISNESPHVAPDAGDTHLWALMHCEPNAALVTGDQLLLNNPYPGRVVLPPRDLWPN